MFQILEMHTGNYFSNNNGSDRKSNKSEFLHPLHYCKEMNFKRYGAHHPMTGPDTILLIDTKLGKFRNFSSTPTTPTSPPTPPSSLHLTASAKPLSTFPSEQSPNRIGKLRTWSRSFAKIASFPRRNKGVADCESFDGGDVRNRGPDNAIHRKGGRKSGDRAELSRRAKLNGFRETARAGDRGEEETAARGAGGCGELEEERRDRRLWFRQPEERIRVLKTAMAEH